MSKDLFKEKDLEAFEENYKAAEGYHRRAKQFLEEGQAASVVFNISTVALERYLIALCNLYGFNPANHNYGSLMDTAEVLVDFPEILSQKIRSLDSIINICSLENYHYKNPKDSDADSILSMCSDVSELFDFERIKRMRDAFIQ